MLISKREKMKSILIIDDEQKVLDAYKLLFEEEGFRVIVAQNASAGTRALIAEEIIDIVLLDINMFKIGGTVMRGVIEEYDPDLKVIISSVHSLEEQRKIIPCAFDYFDKACGVEVLLQKVKYAVSIC
jgi:DNA-binding NtrC family response regulator